MGKPQHTTRTYPEIPNQIFLAFCLLGAAILAFSVSAAAQNPAIQEIRIGVQDLETKAKLDPLPGGGTLRMEVGDRVRLRMVALPGGRHTPRYPSTRFWALAGAKRIQLSNIDVEVGSVDVTAVSPIHGGNNQAITLIAFEIEDEDMHFVKKSMRGGTITVEVVEAPPVRPDLPGRPGHPDERRGITLYEHQNFRGTAEKFTSDVRDLRNTRIQPDRASSVTIDRGCQAILYEHPDFQGRSTVVTGSIEDLGRERVGNDTASAIRLDCSGRGIDDRPGRPDGGFEDGGRGITLYEHQDFQGDSEKFSQDIRDLRGTHIREDRASSVRIDRGCEAILFEHPDFQGRSTVVTGSIEDLRNERVGNDTVSAIRIDCIGRGRGRGRDVRDVRDTREIRDEHRPGYGRGVTLYDDTGYRGRSATFHEGSRDLRDSRVGDHRARSVRLDPRCRAILWTGPDYRGDQLVVEDDIEDLSRTRIGFDSVTSVEVDCW